MLETVLVEGFSRYFRVKVSRHRQRCVSEFEGPRANYELIKLFSNLGKLLECTASIKPSDQLKGKTKWKRREGGGRGSDGATAHLSALPLIICYLLFVLLSVDQARERCNVVETKIYVGAACTDRGMTTMDLGISRKVYGMGT